MPEAIDRMAGAFGTRAGDLTVQLGPCVRPPWYEVNFSDLIIAQCRERGVERVYDCGTCTAANPEQYYSYRREKGQTGRMLALLALSPHVPARIYPASPELMDRPQPVSRELEVDLENLIRINRNFGSYRLIRRFLERWWKPGGTYRVLDLCTGAGDIPRVMVDWARAHGVMVTIEAVDFQAATVEIASRWSVAYPEISVRQGDVLGDVAADGASYDFVFCSLALHHFSEADAARVLRRGREWATRAVLVADLERGWTAAAGVWLMTAVLYREPMTKYDARLSVRRSFSYDELAGLADTAGWRSFGHTRFSVARQAVWLELNV